MRSSDPVPVPPHLEASFFDRPAGEVAPDLLGCMLMNEGVGGVVVEVERYQQDDPASHSFHGPTPRAAIMFGPPGRAYVYRSYGVHWCVNVVCDREGRGSAVLLRALEATHGLAEMRRRRGPVRDRDLCSGPGRLTQALAIDSRHNGTSFLEGDLSLHERVFVPQMVVGPRIGISRAVEQPWRLGVADSRALSRPFPQPTPAVATG